MGTSLTRGWRWALVWFTTATALLTSACAMVPGLITQYEYDETVDLSLDGSATVYVNGSIPALVALHGVDFDVDPLARFNRAAIRRLYTAPGVMVRQLTTSRRNGRRFVHITLDVDDVQTLSALGPLSWSRYRLNRANGEYMFTQTIQGSAHRPVPGVEWTGRELVAFRLHLPSRVLSSTDNLKRGNIVVWEQPFADRLAGAPTRFETRMETQSILFHTLLLFSLTFLAAVATLAVIVWLVVRQGRVATVANGSQRA